MSLPDRRSASPSKLKPKATALVRPMSDTLILGVAFVVGLFICVVSAVANAFLLKTQHAAAPLLMKCNAVGGVIAMLLVWRLLRWSRERNQLLRERAEVVVQLNHEIRNAIQTISIHGYGDSGGDHVLNESVARIEQALDEYVPNDIAIWETWRAERLRTGEPSLREGSQSPTKREDGGL
jgi:hypothetical protein